jgi:hypothetical protein
VRKGGISMARAKNQVLENRLVMLMMFGDETRTQKMLKMKSPLDELLKTNGLKNALDE